MGIFKKFKSKEKKLKEKQYRIGMNKTRNSFSNLNELFNEFNEVNEDLFDQIEEILILSDIGVKTTVKLVDAIRNDKKILKSKNVDSIKELIVDKMFESYNHEYIEPLKLKNSDLSVLLFVGVNGVGKTTSIAKIAYQLKKQGKKVVLAAGDTFRAGAIEQLKEWGNRIDIPVIYKDPGSDPSSVAFEAIQYAKNNDADVLLIDTAGRLQNKVNLMKELEKIKKIISREVPDAPNETLLVIDATTGQNGLSQAINFNNVTKITGLIITKMDGTAKGGIVIAINSELNIPIKYIGLGEQKEDLKIFNFEDYIYTIFQDFFE